MAASSGIQAGSGQAASGQADSGQADSAFVDALVQLSFAVQAILSRVAARYDVSVIQVRLLGILRDREPAMAELARFLRLDKSSITGLVDRAERRGMVQRVASAHDGRSVRVALTPAGRELAAAFAAEVAQHINGLARDLTDAQRGRLSALATQFLAAENLRAPW